MERACDVCGTAYEARRPASRYCSPKCRKRASRRVKSGEPVAQVVQLPAAGAGVGELELATLEELEKVGRAGTALAKATLMLARGIDTAPAESGSSAAARFREWQAMLAKATAGTGVEKSALDRAKDQLAERRARRSQRGA